MRVCSWLAVAATFFLLACGVASAADPKFPALSGRVVDEAGLLSAAEHDRLVGQLEAHERATGQQVVVVTLRSLQGLPVEDFGYRLGRFWGIGEKGKNTGALLVVAASEHAVRIEVGYGLEGLLTDALSRSIVERDVLPAFRQGQFARGIIDGTSAMLLALGGNAAGPPARGVAAAPGAGADLSPLIFIAVVLLFIALRFFFFRGSGPGMLAGAALWSAGSRGSSGGNFGGFSGGGFSGGGGSFGGGGASGTW